jgi:hypothetical protein
LRKKTRSECRERGTKKGRKEGRKKERKKERKKCYDYISILIFKTAFINEINGVSKCK